ncbi:MotA/TolQ/ExbB proton channel [Methanosalsum zhilinae DSM 4017]|uniref:MotA/TolQ/ExbB proton channel n=1 Tax=Methanosalsum zhilinae (strain DSM 4017 / NBRC 107636 / OCM 62 / WeN5) TaxID=679901 RepID=F7XLJ9_METZD|nr:MotA/TolQ/ExbB proton channel family protein [Methanosalsum zhilinae]AEH60818.1 MotA/TolQ/ExbB proton channel [Methanosalsum zhilinae DSM 4017]
MDPTSLIFGILYTFSSSLLYPVIVVLLLLSLLSLILIGEFLSEYSKRNRDVENLESTCLSVQERMQCSDFAGAAKSLKTLKQTNIVTSFANSAAKHLEVNRIPAIEWISEDYEIKMAKNLEQTRVIAAVAPMLGLMGTLIPLGPALIGLSQGNIEQLANNLIVAFATTVIGLFAGSIAYVLTQVRKRWYWQDMADIDYILNTLEGK